MRHHEFDSAVGAFLPELGALEERCQGVSGEGDSVPERVQERVEAVQVCMCLCLCVCVCVCVCVSMSVCVCVTITTTTEGIFSYTYTHSHSHAHTHTHTHTHTHNQSLEVDSLAMEPRLQALESAYSMWVEVGEGGDEEEEDDALGTKEEAEGRYHVLLERITRLKEALLSELTE